MFMSAQTVRVEVYPKELTVLFRDGCSRRWVGFANFSSGHYLTTRLTDGVLEVLYSNTTHYFPVAEVDAVTWRDFPCGEIT